MMRCKKLGLVLVIAFVLSALSNASPNEKGHGAHKQHALPHGLTKKMQRGGSLPPGWQKKVRIGHALPADITAHAKPLTSRIGLHLPLAGKGEIYVEIEGKAVRMNKDTKAIIEIIDILSH